MLTAQFAFFASLLIGAYICTKIEMMRLNGTKIPFYGFASTVMATKHCQDMQTKLTYFFMLLAKGSVFLLLYLVFFTFFAYTEVETEGRVY